jgi:hypothetical protein
MGGAGRRENKKAPPSMETTDTSRKSHALGMKRVPVPANLRTQTAEANVASEAGERHQGRLSILMQASEPSSPPSRGTAGSITSSSSQPSSRSFS